VVHSVCGPQIGIAQRLPFWKKGVVTWSNSYGEPRRRAQEEPRIATKEPKKRSQEEPIIPPKEGQREEHKENQ